MAAAAERHRVSESVEAQQPSRTVASIRAITGIHRERVVIRDILKQNSVNKCVERNKM